MRFMDLGAPELLLIVVVLVLVFGASKLGDIGGALGKSVKEFKQASQGDDAAPTTATATTEPTTPVTATPVAALPAPAPMPAPSTTAQVSDYRPAV
jgi:sec-independent protein translocase protein TatA